MIMEKLVTITIVAVIKMFYGRNSVESKKQNRKKYLKRLDLVKNWS